VSGAQLVRVYDLSVPDGWRAAHRHRHLWGRRFCEHYFLDEDHLLIVFIPGGERWASWEARRERLIVGQDPEGRAAA